eukprot:COSAG06_NODE_31148_length_526_cov_0.964871_1_plen_89_part_01
MGRDGPFKLRHGYRKPCASGNDVFDVPGSSLIDADEDVFLGVLESPRVMELVLEIIGQDVLAPGNIVHQRSNERSEIGRPPSLNLRDTF